MNCLLQLEDVNHGRLRMLASDENALVAADSSSRIIRHRRVWRYLMQTILSRLTRAWTTALLLAVVASLSHAQNMRVHFIDVGQGAATLIEFPCAAMLIDTGGENPSTFDSTEALMKYLDNFFAQRSDLQDTFHSPVITHPHIVDSRTELGPFTSAAPWSPGSGSRET